MHEYSIVAALIEQCEGVANENGAECVERVVVSIGEQNGVEVALLKSSFEAFRADSALLKNAVLEIERAPGRELMLMRVELGVAE